MENIMVWIWLAVTVIAIVVEIITPELVSLWFAIGGIVGIAFSFIPGLPWWGEIIIFAVLSMILLLSLRPVLSKYLKRKSLATNVDRLIGQDIRMITQADFDNLGTAKIGDVVWSVKSENQSSLLADEIVRIVAVDGNKLIARHIENAQTEG
ncbi:MAG: NfeD family protein [Clostridia bacterium]|jgi:membrane protein implicated in regulation of membrane protease activity|nr:NfeD family protein [Clostridia bacterium]